jgi:hypothetical protein
VSDALEQNRQRLRGQISERLKTGLLPRYRGQRVFGGRGEGRPCSCCDEPIAAADVQYDLDQRDLLEGGVEQVRNLVMHLHCYRLWSELSESTDPG